MWLCFQRLTRALLCCMLAGKAKQRLVRVTVVNYSSNSGQSCWNGWWVVSQDQFSQDQLVMRSTHFFNVLFYGTRASWGKHQSVLIMLKCFFFPLNLVIVCVQLGLWKMSFIQSNKCPHCVDGNYLHYLVRDTLQKLIGKSYHECSFRIIEQADSLIKEIPKHNYHPSTPHNFI